MTYLRPAMPEKIEMAWHRLSGSVPGHAVGRSDDGSNVVPYHFKDGDRVMADPECRRWLDGIPVVEVVWEGCTFCVMREIFERCAAMVQ